MESEIESLIDSDLGSKLAKSRALGRAKRVEGVNAALAGRIYATLHGLQDNGATDAPGAPK